MQYVVGMFERIDCLLLMLLSRTNKILSSGINSTKTIGCNICYRTGTLNIHTGKKKFFSFQIRSTSRPELLRVKRSLVWAKHRRAHQPVHNCTRTVLVHLVSSARTQRSVLLLQNGPSSSLPAAEAVVGLSPPLGTNRFSTFGHTLHT
jgi:hypothetical protein